MKDKFQIFTSIIYRELDVNHDYIYITIGQIARIMMQVELIYEEWDEKNSLEENVNNHFSRNIEPMGSCGANRLGGSFDKSSTF